MPKRPLVLLTLAALAAGPATQPDPQQKAALAKYWADQLASANKYLALKGPAAAGLDRVGLWMQKAEALIQTGQMAPAAQALDKAAAEPGVAPDRADAAKALAALVRRSDRRGFHPPATKQQPSPPTYPILDAADRPAAFAALWAFESDRAAAALDRAKSATDAKAVADLAQMVADLRPLDRVVHKSSAQTDGLEQTLASNFAAAAGRWASVTTDALIDLQKAAAETVTDTRTDKSGRVIISQHARGLTSAQQAGVQKDIDAAQHLAGAYTDLTAALSPAAQVTLQPVKPAVQKTYDLAASLRNMAYRTK